MSTIINLYAGPGAGKSTSAAYVFSRFKNLGKNAELVTEYAKSWAWEDRKIDQYAQLYFLGQQSRRESMLYNRADYIITDSPVLLGVYYAEKFCPKSISDGIRAATLGFYSQSELDGHKHIHILLKRKSSYETAGRYQTQDEAIDMDSGIKEMLDRLQIKYKKCNTNDDSLNSLVNNILL